MLTPRGFLLSASIMIKKQYDKPYLSLNEQIEKLKSRGLFIEDTTSAKHYLSIVGYYRLSSYSYRFETKTSDGKRSHHFQKDTQFSDIVKIYVFDQKLRLLMLEALERLEVAARATWAHALSEKCGSHAFMNVANFRNSKEFSASLRTLEKEVERSSRLNKEIAHYIKTYEAPNLPPIWMVVSLMSFGELLRWINNTKSTTIRLKVAQRCGFPNIDLFTGVTRSLTTVRNICAHHCRLWDNRLLTRMPLIKKNLCAPMQSVLTKSGIESDNRMYNCIVVLAHILLQLNHDSSWVKRVSNLVRTNLTEKEQSLMGFPENWETIDLWKL